MTIERIQSVVLEVLQEVQTLCGRSWTRLEPTDKPIGSLDGFDSLAAVEATVIVEEKLGCRDLGVETIFVSEDGKRALSINEIARRISKLLAADGVKA
jgi:acyl carrier protein